MKKTLLLLAALPFAMGSYAQLTTVNNLPEVQKVRDLGGLKLDVQPTAYNAQAAKGPRKTVADGVHYTRPEGVLFYGWAPDWGYMAVSRIFVPTYNDFMLTNDCQVPGAASWSITNSQGTTYELTEEDGVDENNNFVYSTGCYGGGIYMPKITTTSGEYLYGETTYDGEAAANLGYNAILTDSIDGQKSFYNSYTAANYGFGSMDSGYLFGTGNFISSDRTTGEIIDIYQSRGLVQYFAKPASPLYVERFYMPVWSQKEENPLPEGKSLYITIRKVEDSDTALNLTDEILYSFEVKAEDFVKIQEDPYANDYVPSGNVYYYTMTLSNKVPGAFGGIVEAPMTFDTPFAIIIDGFEQEGVDVGARVSRLHADDMVGYDREICHALAYNEEEEIYTAYYGPDTRLTIFFDGGFDYCEVLDSYFDGKQTYENINVLHVSADASECVNEGWPEGLEDKAVAFVAYNWLDFNTYSENYWDEDMPDWIYEIAGTEVTDEEGYFNGQVMLAPDCEKLPEGMKGRYACINLSGRGYKSAAPLWILQGDITLEEAMADYQLQNINDVNIAKTTAKSIYNLCGQRVNGQHKGLVIANGKKVIRK